MKERVYSYLRPSEIKPEGWLKKQLELQAKGLSGHLDLVWPDIRDSKWIGGDREGWERVPYWLDGFIPLAYLLEREDLKARAKRYIDAILERQQKDGWICPCEEDERADYDVWAAFLICKVLVVYEQCSGDERIEQAVYDVLKQLLKHIAKESLFGWGAARWFECLIPLLWLYERRQEPWMLDLAYVLEGCGFDYEKLFRNLSYDKPEVHSYWTLLNHVVNMAMALKCRGEMSLLTGEDADAFALSFYQKLIEKHGTAIGHFTGDECLSGTSPIQGTECCSIVEAMYSYEELLSIGGNSYWGDLLEQIAFNGLAATVSADMWTHQYVQQVNQVQCTRIPDDNVPFNSNQGDAHIFGLEPHFGCCTSNFNQGWPKFALSTIMRSKGGLAVTAYAPVEVNTIVNDCPVKLKVQTEYPFRDKVCIEISTEKPVEFELSLRVPGFAKAARLHTIDEEGIVKPVENVLSNTFYKYQQLWTGRTIVELEFTFEPEFVKQPDDMFVLRRGPLFYALPISYRQERVEYEKDGVERKYPYCDYQTYPTEEWQFGFAGQECSVIWKDFPEMPFDREYPPIVMEVDMVPLDWKMKNDMCKEKPESTTPVGTVVKKKLQPYGCTTLRMTQMPMCQK